jgi:guanylate kinase
MIRNNEFLEHADVFGEYYGTARSTLREAFAAGRDLLLDIDVQGAAQVRAKMPEAVSIFLMPPSPEILAYRLRNRSRAEGVNREEIIEKRLAKAKQEIENYREYGYILVNDILEVAVDQMASIVGAERIRRGQVSTAPPAEVERTIRLAEGCQRVNSEARIQPILRAFGVPETGV